MRHRQLRRVDDVKLLGIVTPPHDQVGPIHADEIDIAEEAARELIAGQFPEWAQLPVGRIESSGTVNAIFRIGEHLTARFSLRAADPGATRQLLEQQAQASDEFARHSPFPSPVPVAIGDPGGNYPLPWSVQTWLPGAVATESDPSGSVAFAHDLATLVGALRAVDTRGRVFQGDRRGGDLQNHDGRVETALRKSGHLLDVSGLATMWGYFRDLPRTSPDVMTHGDLIPGNVLVAEDRLAGVLDCGGFGPADPALDVIAGWHLLDDGPRAVFRADLRCDDVEWERSKAWAFEQALGAVWYYAATNRAMSAMGHRTLRRILANTPV
jgi:aminoglycoside phosphotransferase (APT) family kinase protein